MLLPVDRLNNRIQRQRLCQDMNKLAAQNKIKSSYSYFMVVMSSMPAHRDQQDFG